MLTTSKKMKTSSTKASARSRRFYTDDDVRRAIRRLIADEFDGIAANLARAYGVTTGFVSLALSGQRSLPAWMAEAVGFTVCKAYVKADA
jgi:hypothetical protein